MCPASIVATLPDSDVLICQSIITGPQGLSAPVFFKYSLCPQHCGRCSFHITGVEMGTEELCGLPKSPSPAVQHGLSLPLRARWALSLCHTASFLCAWFGHLNIFFPSHVGQPHPQGLLLSCAPVACMPDAPPPPHPPEVVCLPPPPQRH